MNVRDRLTVRLPAELAHAVRIASAVRGEGVSKFVERALVSELVRVGEIRDLPPRRKRGHRGPTALGIPSESSGAQ